jgi:hypothetical protein
VSEIRGVLDFGVVTLRNPLHKLHHAAHASNFWLGGRGVRWRSIGKYLQVVRNVICRRVARFFGVMWYREV